MKKPENKLDELVSRLRTASGDNLVSVVLYGSAAREEFHEQYSDVNVLAVFRDLGAGPLSALTPVIRWWTHEEKFTPPLMMTEVELRESADVFAIELLDIQHAHQTLFGEDIVGAIHVPMNLHRVEVEHELRSTLLRLRQHLLLSPDNEGELKLVLAKSISGVLTLVRHALIALGVDPPRDKAKLAEHAGQVLGFDSQPLQTILDFRNNREHPVDTLDVYNSYMSAIGRVAHELDARAPKRHWQRTSGTT
jgi:predicted nucleotidyltransferase